MGELQPETSRHRAGPAGQPGLPLVAGLVGDAEVFAHQHWGRRPLHRPGARGVPRLTVADVEAMLDTSIRSPSIRLVRDGVPLPAAVWTRPLRLGGVDLDDVADGSAVADAFRNGASIVLQGLHRTWPPLVGYARELEDEISHPVQVNAYFTPPGSSGLARHHDAHDVLVVQMEGTKQWWVDGLGELVMRPGDAMYVPAGTAHQAHATRHTSLHLTIGVLRRTVRHVVDRVVRDADALSTPLPLGFARADPASLDEMLRPAIAEFGVVLRRLGTDELSRAAVGGGRRRPPVAGSLRAVDDAVAVEADTVLSVPAGWSLEERIGGATVAVDGRSLQVPSVAVAALRHLTSRGRSVVGELPGLDDDGRLVLARRLVRERLAIVDAADAADAADVQVSAVADPEPLDRAEIPVDPMSRIDTRLRS